VQALLQGGQHEGRAGPALLRQGEDRPVELPLQLPERSPQRHRRRARHGPRQQVQVRLPAGVLRRQLAS